jgi:PIN domain nuclease of toxin-antitoxin system
VRLLLDTHALLWFALGDKQLTGTARTAIENPVNEKWVSPASYWEIAVKIGIGKYQLKEDYDAFMQRAIFGNGFEILHIQPHHTSILTALPFHHRDPFDRLLIAQALVEKMPIVSGDRLFDAYGVQRVW